MKYLALDLVTESPLTMRADHSPGGVASAPFIAGTALAGSLAAAHRLLADEQRRDFERFFLSEQIQYPHLYPASFKAPEAQQARYQPVYPLPRTARSCKRFPGFAGDEAENRPHGVRDSLFDWAIFELGGQTHASLGPLQAHRACTTCGKAMHHFSGFYRRFEQDVTRLYQASVEMRLQTHTGINRETGTVQEGILYSRQVFQEQTHFAGVIKVPDELAEGFAHVLAQLGESGLVRIGTARTRGLGKVRLSSTFLPDSGLPAFARRIARFDQELRTRVAKVLPGFERPVALYFALTLHSPVLLRDHLLRTRGCIDAQTLSELTDLPAEAFTLLYQNADRRRIAGWNELWGTPREGAYALETGSVFLFAFHAQEVQAQEQLLERLQVLEEAGLGQRRGEGFGRICLSDPFHLERGTYES